MIALYIVLVILGIHFLKTVDDDIERDDSDMFLRLFLGCSFIGIVIGLIS